jgi:hypothetical protein
MNKVLKAYQVDDMDLYAAYSKDQARRLYKGETGDDCDDGYPFLVSKKECDRLIPDFDEDENPNGQMTCISEWLRTAAPGFLASTEGF